MRHNKVGVGISSGSLFASPSSSGSVETQTNVLLSATSNDFSEMNLSDSTPGSSSPPADTVVKGDDDFPKLPDLESPIISQHTSTGPPSNGSSFPNSPCDTTLPTDAGSIIKESFSPVFKSSFPNRSLQFENNELKSDHNNNELKSRPSAFIGSLKLDDLSLFDDDKIFLNGLLVDKSDSNRQVFNGKNPTLFSKLFHNPKSSEHLPSVQRNSPDLRHGFRERFPRLVLLASQIATTVRSGLGRIHRRFPTSCKQKLRKFKKKYDGRLALLAACVLGLMLTAWVTITTSQPLIRVLDHQSLSHRDKFLGSAQTLEPISEVRNIPPVQIPVKLRRKEYGGVEQERNDGLGIPVLKTDMVSEKTISNSRREEESPNNSKVDHIKEGSKDVEIGNSRDVKLDVDSAKDSEDEFGSDRPDGPITKEDLSQDNFTHSVKERISQLRGRKSMNVVKKETREDGAATHAEIAVQTMDDETKSSDRKETSVETYAGESEKNIRIEKKEEATVSGHNNK